MIVARFDKLDAPPAKILFWQTITHCTTRAEISRHKGEIIAVYGRTLITGGENQKPSFFKVSRKNYIHFQSHPKSLQNTLHYIPLKKKFFIIARVQSNLTFFEWAPATSIPGYTFTYFEHIYWHDLRNPIKK